MECVSTIRCSPSEKCSLNFGTCIRRNQSFRARLPEQREHGPGNCKAHLRRIEFFDEAIMNVGPKFERAFGLVSCKERKGLPLRNPVINLLCGAESLLVSDVGGQPICGTHQLC